MTARGASLWTAVVVLALAAAPALAQPPAPPSSDPIDALLRQKTVDPDEPDTAATGSRVDPDPVLPAQPYAPPRPILTEPVFLHETGKAPDGPPTAADQAYDSRLRSSAAAVRGYQGPMEGGWTLTASGRPLYALQLVDRGGYVDGAWRDLRRPGATEGSGYIDDVQRSGGAMTIRVSAGVTAVLHAVDGGWTGQITEDGKTEAATLSRRAP